MRPSSSISSRTQSSISLPVVGVEEDDREVPDLLRLPQGQRLPQLVLGAEAAGEDDEAFGGLDEHDLSHVEVVEGEREVTPRVQILLERQRDVEADREPAGLLATTVRGLHHSRPAARDDCEARLRERAACRACLLVRRRAVGDAG